MSARKLVDDFQLAQRNVDHGLQPPNHTHSSSSIIFPIESAGFHCSHLINGPICHFLHLFIHVTGNQIYILFALRLLLLLPYNTQCGLHTPKKKEKNLFFPQNSIFIFQHLFFFLLLLMANFGQHTKYGNRIFLSFDAFFLHIFERKHTKKLCRSRRNFNVVSYLFSPHTEKGVVVQQSFLLLALRHHPN